MADTSVSSKLEEYWKRLPNAINGNGQNFIYLLKDVLSDLSEELNSKFEEVSKIANSITDAPDEMDEQLKNCTIKEVRVGTDISFVLTWDYSDVENYDSAEIYVKETKGDIVTHEDWSNVEVSRTVRTTKTNTYTLENINAGYIYQITFQAKNTFGSVSRESGCPVLTYAVSAMDNSPDPPLEFDVYFDKNGCYWTWKQPVNLDYSFSELRTDENVGSKVGLLEVTQDTKSTAMPSTREGTAYLYNKGFGSKYSTAVTKPWSKPVPSAPQTLTVDTEFQGLVISYSVIPEDCIGICISINGEKHYTSDDSFHYYCVMGDFTIKAAYYDCFGEGTWTDEQTVSVVTLVDPTWLQAESVTLEKVDKVIQTAVKEAQDSVEAIASANSNISGIISELQKSPGDSAYKSITDLKTDLTTAQSDLSTVSSDLATKTAALSTEITGVKTSLTGLTSTVNTNSGNITLLEQRATDIETTVADNNTNLASQISQNADSISAVVTNLNSVDLANSPYQSITTLKQTTDSISSTVSANKSATDAAISQVSQKADSIQATIENNLNATDPSLSPYTSITQLQANINGVSSTVALNKSDTDSEISQIKQTEASIQTTVTANKTAQDAQNTSFVSQITQNATNISSVVTDLTATQEDLADTKTKVDSNYTAIVQNQNDIAMRVKTGELIQQINLSEEGISINGSKIHITGDTVFDSGIIVSSYIGDSQVVGTKIADGAISTAKLSANSVTANKLATNSVTADKIAVGAVTAGKIAAGAVSAASIAAGSITSDKLTTGAVTAEKLAVGSVGADAISAQSITGEKIKAGSITASCMSVSSLSSLSATIGTLRTATTGARLEIKDNLISIYDANNTLRLRMGVWN